MSSRDEMIATVNAAATVAGIAVLLLAPALLLASVDPQVTQPAPEAPATSASGLPPPEANVEAPKTPLVVPTQHGKIGHIWAPVLINGKGPFRLVFDTGANSTAVTAHVANELGLPMLAGDSLVVHGATGSATVPAIKVENLTVGDMELRSHRLPILASGIGGADGVLGMEGLVDRRIVVDFLHDAITIRKSQSERAPPDFVTIPFFRVAGTLPVVDARVGNVPTRVIVVTGAQGSLGNAALYEALLREHSDGAASPDVITGATGDVQHGLLLALPPIELRGLTLQGVRITTGDWYLFQHWKFTRKKPYISVGMDVLGQFDTLIIDYRREELQVQLRTGG
jgi:predicted aspartyl protease